MTWTNDQDLVWKKLLAPSEPTLHKAFNTPLWNGTLTIKTYIDRKKNYSVRAFLDDNELQPSTYKIEYFLDQGFAIITIISPRYVSISFLI